MWAGSCGATQGANSAQSTNTATNMTPTAASGLWRARRGSEMATADMVKDESVLLIYKTHLRGNVGQTASVVCSSEGAL